MLGVLHAQVDYVFCDSMVCMLFVCYISACEPELVVARSSPRSVCLHLSELLLGVLYAQANYVFYSSEPQVLLVRVWALDVWGELVPSKIFNPPFPVLKAGHSVSYSCV